MQLEFHPEARQDIRSATRWYAERSSTAATGFATALAYAIRAIHNTPERFARVGGARTCSLIGYPYQVVFEIRQKDVRVLAVAHAKRRPRYWTRRRMDP